MIQISKNRYLDALLKSFVFFAVIHLAFISMHSILAKDLAQLNLFNILEITLFFPVLGQGIFNFILSIIVFLAIYLTFFFLKKR